MNHAQVETSPSATAYFTALRRALAHREFHDEKFGPDHLAEVFIPAKYRFFLRFGGIRKKTLEKLDGFMPGMTEYIIARTAFFDRLFQDALRDQIAQIVLLGAGYDTRAYRFAHINQGTKIFELDAAPTQNRKIQCLKDAHIGIPKEVQFVPIDFQNEPLSDVLGKAGYREQERTLYLWEGVSYYLDHTTVAETLGIVSRSHQDSLIAMDYTISIPEDNLEAYYGAEEFLKSMQEYHAQEELVFSIQDGQIESFLAESNLMLIQHLDQEEIEGQYLVDDHGALIGRMTGVFRFACASPAK